MSLPALATAEPVGAVSANDEAVADMGDHSAHVSAFLRHEHINKLAALRDEFVRIATDGRFVDSASREWRGIPIVWREALLLLAGCGRAGSAPEARDDQVMASLNENVLKKKQAMHSVEEKQQKQGVNG